MIQDDALVCQNFEAALDRVMAIFPDSVVCLFWPGLKTRSMRNISKAVSTKTGFFRVDRGDFVAVVGTLWPRAKVESLLQWTEERVIPGLRPPYRSDDAVIGSWARHTKQDVYATLPSLVEHPDDAEPVKDGPHKAANGADRGRVAYSFCEGDPLAINWTTPSTASARPPRRTGA